MAKKSAQNIMPPEKVEVYVYIGPSIRGLIISGSIWRGTRKQVFSLLADVLERYPKVEKLIVPSHELTDKRKKVKTEGNSLYYAYRSILSEENKKG